MSMINPKITIITAAWRVAGVKKVIECLNNQTFQDFDHLIVNDHNPEVREWLKENNYFEDDLRRHVIDSHVRGHFFGGIARNLGVLMAFAYKREIERDLDSEFITFFDDDNSWENDHLESFVEVLKKNPNATLIGSDMVKVGVQDTSWRGIVPCVIKHGHCDLGEFLYKGTLFRNYGLFWPRPKRKHRFDIELLEKIAKGEKENVYFTHKPTLTLSYRKK